MSTTLTPTPTPAPRRDAPDEFVSRRPRRHRPSWVAITIAVVAALVLSAQQYVVTRDELDRARSDVHDANGLLHATDAVAAAHITAARAAADQDERTRRQVAAVVEARRAIELAIAQVQDRLDGTNDLVQQAAAQLLTVAGSSNDAQQCLDGVTFATVAISTGNDRGALRALQHAADACNRTLVADDANVNCAQNSLGSAAALQAFFDRRSELWAGADLTGVVPLPDGRKLWLFGDTVYTPVRDDGGRGPLVGFGNNSAFVQRNGCMRHVAGGSAQRSWLVPPQGDGSAYWPGGGVVVGDRMYLFLGRIVPEAPFGRLLDRAVATLTVPDLHLVGISPLPFSSTGPGWGAAAIAPGDGFVYTYGTRRPDCDNCFASDVYVARVPAWSVTDASTWAFWDGGTWRADPNAARPVMTGGGSSVNVQRWRGGWLAISKAADILSPDIVGWWAPGPNGPWSALGPLYRVPSVPSAKGDVYTYMPDLIGRRADGRLLLAYNVGSLSETTSQADATLYGPRFVEVDVPFVAGMR